MRISASDAKERQGLEKSCNFVISGIIDGCIARGTDSVQNHLSEYVDVSRTENDGPSTSEVFSAGKGGASNSGSARILPSLATSAVRALHTGPSRLEWPRIADNSAYLSRSLETCNTKVPALRPREHGPSVSQTEGAVVSIANEETLERWELLTVDPCMLPPELRNNEFLTNYAAQATSDGQQAGVHRGPLLLLVPPRGAAMEKDKPDIQPQVIFATAFHGEVKKSSNLKRGT